MRVLFISIKKWALLMLLLTSSTFGHANIFEDLQKAVGASYPQPRIINTSPFRVQGKISKAACSDDYFDIAAGQTWSATNNRGLCLITGISGRFVNDGGKFAIQSYESSGTSYAGFRLSASNVNFRFWSEGEWARDQAGGGKSPGFYIVNKTDWPIAFSINQTGCIKHGTVPSGGHYLADSGMGAVWYTLKAQVQPDGKDPLSTWDCLKPVAAITGTVLLAAATGGYGAFAAGAALGAAATTSAIVVAGVTATAIPLAKWSAKEIGELIQENGEGELKFQYAGPEWPFRCDQMPIYNLTGGPRLTVENGQPTLTKGTPLKFYKQNDCGNSMMAGSVPPSDPNPGYMPSTAAFGNALANAVRQQAAQGAATSSAPTPQAIPANLAQMLAAGYVHTPPAGANYTQNDWHIGSLVQDASGLSWRNKAGSVWKLTSDLAQLKLHTGPDNPYYAQGQRDIGIVVSNGQLAGININGAFYARTAMAAAATAQPAPAQQVATTAATALIYGGQYHLLNGYANWTGGYLDTNNVGCEGNLLCVSTANSAARDGNSGTWMILPAMAGRAAGQPVQTGDEIYLANMYGYAPSGGMMGSSVGNFGGFLDTRNAGCRGDLLCVSTASVNNRDPSRTGVWKIETVSGVATISSTTAVTLRNAYSNYGGGYLNTNNVGCQGNRYCVSTSANRERVAGSGTTQWMISPK